MKSDKDLYRQLRALPRETLWTDEVARFDKASPRERLGRVAVIRAVGVAFAGAGDASQKAAVRAWLIALLRDPEEKIRRYATAALPKLGSGPAAEAEMLALLRAASGEREKKALGSALAKIGGEATLDAVSGLLPQTEQKVKARVARTDAPSTIRLNHGIDRFDRLRLHLRCRHGLEDLVRDEAEELLIRPGRFSLLDVRSGCVAITPLAPFSLADLFRLRCFATASFAVELVRDAHSIEALASAIASPLSRRLLRACTEGALRYRLNFVGKGHQRGAVRDLTSRAYAKCPEILNDPRDAPWSVDLFPVGRGLSVELRPRLSPDPRFTYRTDDVAASSHPPLAACMARLAGRMDNEVAWDTFCGSGQELVERALRGGVKQLVGTDLSAEALAIAAANLKAAGFTARLACGDFRDEAKAAGPESVTLIITNPPMGRRVRIADMAGLFTDLFRVAARVLAPGGRLVFPNPLRLEPRGGSLKLEYRKVVDLGGFNCRLEVYRKPGEDARTTAGRAAAPA